MKILGIDSTTKILSVAVSEKYLLRSEVVDENSQKHMANIIHNIDKALKEAKIDIGDIDLFCSNLGPGDFTGTRIGLSILKMFSRISLKQFYGISAIESSMVSTILKNYENIMSKLAKGIKITLIPLMDVRNNQIYFSIYRVDNKKENIKTSVKKAKAFINIKDLSISLVEGEKLEDSDKIVERISEKIISESQSEDLLKKSIILSGNFFVHYPDMDTCLKNKLKDISNKDVFFTDRSTKFTTASVLNYISYARFMNNIKSLPAFPIYVRDFAAFKK